MKPILALALCFLADCGALPGLGVQDQDCGYVAEIEQGQDEKQLEITFYRSLSEVVNFQENCDFAFVPVRVEKSNYNGHPLLEIEGREKPAYAPSAAVTPSEPVIGFQIDGKGYISDLGTVQQTGKRIRVKMRRFPPK